MFSNNSAFSLCFPFSFVFLFVFFLEYSLHHCISVRGSHLYMSSIFYSSLSSVVGSHFCCWFALLLCLPVPRSLLRSSVFFSCIYRPSPLNIQNNKTCFILSSGKSYHFRLTLCAADGDSERRVQQPYVGAAPKAGLGGVCGQAQAAKVRKNALPPERKRPEI